MDGVNEGSEVGRELGIMKGMCEGLSDGTVLSSGIWDFDGSLDWTFDGVKDGIELGRKLGIRDDKFECKALSSTVGVADKIKLRKIDGRLEGAILVKLGLKLGA